MKYRYNDSEFGDMLLLTRKGMRQMSVRWTGKKPYEFEIHAPEGINKTEIDRFIASNREAIKNLRRTRKQLYHAGQVIPCFGGTTITIRTHNHDNIIYGPHNGNTKDLEVVVPEFLDLSLSQHEDHITFCIEKLITILANIELPFFADRIAKQLGVAAGEITIGRGLKKLGHCTCRTHDILLSRNLVFLPEHLIRFVVCHELAHVTHPDHSAAFHELCNKYCDGRERELDAELKAFIWPIKR